MMQDGSSLIVPPFGETIRIYCRIIERDKNILIPINGNMACNRFR
jgi:hypothetical protein